MYIGVILNESGYLLLYLISSTLTRQTYRILFRLKWL